MLVTLTSMILCGMVASAISEWFSLHGMVNNLPLPAPFATGCALVGGIAPDHLYLDVLPNAITTCILFFLTAYRIMHLRWEHGKTFSSLRMLLKDGILYFAGTCSCLLVNILVFRFARPTMEGVASGFLPVIPYIMACRLMLNLRGFLLETVESKPRLSYVSSPHTPSEPSQPITYAVPSWPRSHSDANIDSKDPYEMLDLKTFMGNPNRTSASAGTY